MKITLYQYEEREEKAREILKSMTVTEMFHHLPHKWKEVYLLMIAEEIGLDGLLDIISKTAYDRVREKLIKDIIDEELYLKFLGDKL